MNIQAEKLHLIEWLAKTTKPSVIKKLKAVKEQEEKDWWDSISAAEKSAVEEGMQQADRGEVVPHKQVMAKYKRWLIRGPVNKLTIVAYRAKRRKKQIEILNFRSIRQKPLKLL